MDDFTAERLAAALDGLLRSSADIEAAAIISFDGLAMASALPAGMDEDRLGAMSAALLSLGEQAVVGLGRGELRQLFVEGDHGFVFLMSAGGHAVLAAVATSAAKIGWVLFEMRRVATTVGDLLSRPAAAAPSAPSSEPSSEPSGDALAAVASQAPPWS